MIIFLITPKQGKKEFWELGTILIISLIVEVSAVIGIFLFHVNMNIASGIFNIVNLPLTILFYKRKLKLSHSVMLNVYMYGFLAFALINFFFIQTPSGQNLYTNSIASITILILAIAYFYHTIQSLPVVVKHDQQPRLSREPMFWINTAILLYNSGTFTITLSADYLVRVLNSNLIVPWMIHNGLGIAYYLILSVALWINRANHIGYSREQKST